MAKTGRPLGLDAALAARIAERCKGGCPPIHAARLEGVPKSTFLSWMKKGRKARSGVFRDLLDQIAAGKAHFIAMNAAVIALHARGRAARAADPATGVTFLPEIESDWKAAAWMLERSDKAFRKQTTTKLKNDKKHPVEFFTLNIPDPTAVRAAAKAAAEDGLDADEE